jgi:hypothetical protein
MIEAATVDAHCESEQAVGMYTMLEEHLALPFDTMILGVKATVERLVRDPHGIARFLRHIGESTEPPPLSPSRAPPYYRSRVLRRRPADQRELFDA